MVGLGTRFEGSIYNPAGFHNWGHLPSTSRETTTSYIRSSTSCKFRANRYRLLAIHRDLQSPHCSGTSLDRLAKTMMTATGQETRVGSASTSPPWQCDRKRISTPDPASWQDLKKQKERDMSGSDTRRLFPEAAAAKRQTCSAEDEIRQLRQQLREGNDEPGKLREGRKADAGIVQVGALTTEKTGTPTTSLRSLEGTTILGSSKTVGRWTRSL
jgi:hypothetical protein